MKGVDKADQYLSYYSEWRKTVKQLNASVTLCTPQSMLVYKH